MIELDISTTKIAQQIIGNLGLSDYIYKPLNKKLGALTPYDYLSDEGISSICNSMTFEKAVENLGVLGIATPIHGKKFLKLLEGRRLINYLIDNSTAKDEVNLDVLIPQTYGEIEDKFAIFDEEE